MYNQELEVNEIDHVNFAVYHFEMIYLDKWNYAFNHRNVKLYFDLNQECLCSLSVWLLPLFGCSEHTQWTHDVIMKSLLRRQNDVAKSFWQINDVIIRSCVRCRIMKTSSHSNGNIIIFHLSPIVSELRLVIGRRYLEIRASQMAEAFPGEQLQWRLSLCIGNRHSPYLYYITYTGVGIYSANRIGLKRNSLCKR